MKIITIGGTTFVGDIEESDGKVILKDAYEVGNTDRVGNGALRGYLKAKNLGKLQDIEIAGAGATYAARDMTEDQKRAFAILELQFDHAEQVAPKELVNDKFDELTKQ